MEPENESIPTIEMSSAEGVSAEAGTSTQASLPPPSLGGIPPFGGGSLPAVSPVAGIGSSEEETGAGSSESNVAKRKREDPPAQEASEEELAPVKPSKKKKKKTYGPCQENKTEIGLKKVQFDAYVLKIKPMMDDDHDNELLQSFQTEMDQIQNESTLLYDGINGASNLIRIDDKLNKLRVAAYWCFQELKATFPTHSGGFGAKGRAHDDEDFGGVRDRKKKGYSQVKSFLRNIKTGDDDMKKSVYKKHKTVQDEASTPKLMNKAVGKLTDTEKSDKLALLEGQLGSIPVGNSDVFTNTPMGADRNGGQAKNMANSNASAYAYLAEIPDWESQRWEWLHIRGAGLGGATGPSNLVVGTRDANTHMIPFESNIRSLATEVHKNDNYKSLNVTWSIHGQYKSLAQHAFKKIKIKWTLKANDGDDAMTEAEDVEGSASFRPLATGTNISKKEVEILENSLKKVRKGIEGYTGKK